MAVTPTTFNVDIGAMLTAHLRNVEMGSPREQAYLGTRVLSQLEKDRDRTVDGGGYIHTQVSATQTALGGSYKDADTAAEGTSDEDTMAITELRFYSEPIMVYRSQVIRAGGTAGAEERLFKYVENKRAQGIRRIRTLIEQHLLATTKGDPDDVTSLVESLTPDPTVSGGTLDGIDRTTDPWFLNQEEEVGSISANFDALESLSLKCQLGGEEDWDYAIADQQTFLWLKKLARTYLSLNAGTLQSEGARRMADLGIPTIEFEGKPVFWSPYLPSNRNWSGYGGAASGGSMLFIKRDAVKWCPVPEEEFIVEGPFPLEARDTPKHGTKWHIMLAAQLVWEKPACCGVAWGITA